jgi:pyruvate ferredoxin oxidoreductase delta subunit
VLVVTSLEDPATLVSMAHRKDQPWRLAVVKATPSFSGLWVYKDDHTDVRILGAVAKLLPELYSLVSLQEVIQQEWRDGLKATSALRAYERIQALTVPPGQGNPEKPYEFQLPKWHEMREGIAIPNIAMGGAVRDPETAEAGGYRPARNPTFKKFTTRTMRPVVDFEKCIKCTLCWLQCPDSCFDVMPDGMYDANMEACCGCGVCEAVCPEKDCVTMVNETHFHDTASQWEAWRKDPDGYRRFVAETIAKRPADRSHGFRFLGQYEQQVPGVLEGARNP